AAGRRVPAGLASGLGRPPDDAGGRDAARQRAHGRLAAADRASDPSRRRGARAERLASPTGPMLDEAPRGAVVPGQIRPLAALDGLLLAQDGAGQHLAELHAPLIETVHAPDDALDGDPVPVQGNEAA